MSDIPTVSAPRAHRDAPFVGARAWPGNLLRLAHRLLLVVALMAPSALHASAATPVPLILMPDSTHEVATDTPVTLVAQALDTAWFRIFIDGIKICDIREPRAVYACPYTTPQAAGTYAVEVRTNRSLPATPSHPNRSFYCTLVVGAHANTVTLSADSSHSVEPAANVTLVARTPDTTWFRIFVAGVKICDIRQPQAEYRCPYVTAASPGRYEVEVRTNRSLMVSDDSPNRRFFSHLEVASEDGTFTLAPGVTHSVESGTALTFSAAVPDTMWFRVFVDDVKICDIRQAQSVYQCDYTAPATSGHYRVEVRTNATLVADDANPNRSFFGTLVVTDTGYVLHFADEFDDAHDGRPNPAHWDYKTGSVINNEQQCYTDNHPDYVDAGVANVRVETRHSEGRANGYLVLELKKEDVACRQANGETFHYTSGAISTRMDGAGAPYLVDMPHGIYEIRAKIPAGRGTWPAIWLLGKKQYTPQSPFTIGWPDAGEIDIMEAVGFEEAMGLYRLHHTLHRNKSRGFLWPHRRPNQTGQGMTLALSEPPSANFHVYKLIWKTESLEFFVDGVRVRKMDMGNGQTQNRDGFFRSDPDMNGWGHDHTANDDHLGWPFAMEVGNRFALILNLAFGGGWGGQQGLDDSIFASGQPVEMLVDYVRVYAENPADNANAAP